MNPPDGVPIAHLDTIDVMLTMSAAPHPGSLYREGTRVYGWTDYQTLTNRLDAANINSHFQDVGCFVPILAFRAEHIRGSADLPPLTSNISTRTVT